MQGMEVLKIRLFQSPATVTRKLKLETGDQEIYAYNLILYDGDYNIGD